MRSIPEILLCAAIAGCAEPTSDGSTSSPTGGGVDLPAVDEERWRALHRDRDPRSIARLEELDQELASAPDDPRLIVERARLYYRLGRNAEAQRALEGVLAGGPDFDASYYLAEIALGDHRFADALGHFERALELRPDYPPAHRERGVALRGLGRDAEALAAFRAALAHAPNDVLALYRAALLVEDDDPNEARALLERAVAIDERHLGAHHNLARILEHLGRTADAAKVRAKHEELSRLADLRVDTEPDSPVRYMAECQLLANNGRDQEALELCREGRGLHPEHADLAFLGGILEERVGLFQDAQRSWLASMAAEPRDPRPLFALASMFANRDDAIEAVPGVRDALERGRRASGDALFERALARLGKDGDGS